jgi:two-component system, chemotaxis family, chemotaxis protein CheY
MSRKVLIVDDSNMIRRQVGNALGKAAFAINEAVDGVDALEKLTRAPDTALVICDVNMPRMNGLELLEQVRSQPAIAAVPFLMLTTEGQPELIARAKKLGAKGWLIKPFKPDLLLAAVQALAKVA